MTKPETFPVRVSDPSELIDAVPYLLGFHPRESLVVIGLNGRARRGRAQLREVRITMRVDIPRSAARPGDFSDLTHALGRASVGAVVCVWITERDTPLRDELLRELSEVLAADLGEAEVEILDVLVASASRWWSLSCDDPGCCPAEGSRRHIGTSIVAAEAALAGLVALPERAAVEARLTGRSEDERRALLPMIEAALSHACRDDDPAVRVARFVAAAAPPGELAGGADGCGEPAQLDDVELASHGVALRDIAVRDRLWMLIDDRALQAEQLLQQLHTRLPAPYDAAPLFLFGWSRWRAGDGTQAVMAAERALRSDERYSAAELLVATVQGGLDPHRTPRLSEAIRAHPQ